MKKTKYGWLCILCVAAVTLSACSSAAPKTAATYDSAPSMSAESETTSDNAFNAGLESAQMVTGSYDRGGSEFDYNLNSNEEYLEISENKQLDTAANPLMTFSLKIDSASYRNVARYIENGSLPPHDAVRIEEMINYFRYDEPLIFNDGPFSIYTELGPSPFDENKSLAFVRVKSKDIDKEQLPASNLTFLIDSSGSMSSYDKLPLLQSAFSMLTENLDENDVVSIVTYAGSSVVVLDSIRGNEQQRIIDAIYSLSAGGSTAGAGGIMTAYELAEKNFNTDNNNRVILATDGDFNVGVSSVSELERLISDKRKSGVYLTILGFGTENLKDNKMETLAKNGNGNYHYIDSVYTAKKILVDELSANLFTVADDVKAQIEFNPMLVDNYRLIGYENRMLANKDFENDQKDAGEIGAGSDVVLLFEIEMSGGQKLKYQNDQGSDRTDEPYSDELFEVRIRYKNPGEIRSLLLTQPMKLDRQPERNSSDFGFAASVSAFGHLLSDSEYTGRVTAQDVLTMARDNMGSDQGEHRREFVDIVEKYISYKRD